MSYFGSNCTACTKTGCSTTFIAAGISSVARAMLHQDKLVDAICHILCMPRPAFEAYCQNDSLDKAIRNFQYVIEEIPPAKAGTMTCPYLNRVYGPLYFRRTDDAESILRAGGHAGAKGDVHYEHAVPVTVIKDRLVALHSTALSNGNLKLEVKDALMASEIVLVSHAQRACLDGAEKNGKLGLQRRMPSGWQWGDCHLARICKLSVPNKPFSIVGGRLIG